jgi:hypothetical protein
MRVMELPTNPALGVVIICPECRAHYSACRADYCFSEPNEVMMCCGLPMELARRTVTYQPVTPTEAEAGS